MSFPKIYLGKLGQIIFFQLFQSIIADVIIFQQR